MFALDWLAHANMTVNIHCCLLYCALYCHYRLGAKSGVLLGRALESNHSLTDLNIAYNATGDEGAQAIGIYWYTLYIMLCHYSEHSTYACSCSLCACTQLYVML
jgi:hypothetical protein